MISFSGILLDDDTIKKSCLISGVEESIEIYHNSKSVVFRTEIRDCEFEFSSTLLEYKFPYDVCKKIIAVEPPNEVVINSVEIRETVKRVVRYTSKELSIAEVRLSKTPSVYAEDLNFGNNAEEELTSIDIPETVKDINIAFNGFKLSTILHQIEEESIFFSFTAENKAVFITPIYPAKREVEYKYMIMPSVTLNK
jgi:DNA polymerase III sliding clamp (beta) subunit (PCNA family)